MTEVNLKWSLEAHSNFNTWTQLPEVLYKRAVLINFAIFKGKDLSWSLFLAKLQLRYKETLFTGIFL